MVQKYTKGQILNNLSKKRIMNNVKDKYREVLVKKDNFSEKKAETLTSGQNKLKKALASRFAHQSERQINKSLRDDFGMKPEKRKQLLEDIKGGGKLSHHQIVELKKKLEKVQNRNLAMSKRQRDEFAAVLGDDELRPSASKKKQQFRNDFYEKKSKVSEDFKTNSSAYQRHGFAGSNNNRGNSKNTANKLGGGNNPNGLVGGVDSNSGGDRIKFTA